MIRRMIKKDLQQCGEIYAMAFPIEYWGIDWNSDNAREYLTDYYEQKRFIGYVYEEDDTIIGCIFAVCKLSGSKKEGFAGAVLYTSEYAPAAKFYEKNGFKLSQGTICMYCE